MEGTRRRTDPTRWLLVAAVESRRKECGTGQHSFPVVDGRCRLHRILWRYANPRGTVRCESTLMPFRREPRSHAHFRMFLCSRPFRPPSFSGQLRLRFRFDFCLTQSISLFAQEKWALRMTKPSRTIGIPGPGTPGMARINPTDTSKNPVTTPNFLRDLRNSII